PFASTSTRAPARPRIIGLPIWAPVVRALTPGRRARECASDTLWSRRSPSSDSAAAESGEPSTALGARVAVMLTGSIHTGVRRNVTVRLVGPWTETSRANGANPTWRTITVY